MSEVPSAYVALGGVLIVALWMKVVSQVLFFGAEICKVVWSTDQVRVDIPMKLTAAP